MSGTPKRSAEIPLAAPAHSVLKDPLNQLLALSHELGAESRRLAILGEGNTSAKLEADTFLVKASGGNLEKLSAAEVVECRAEPLLALLENEEATDEQIDHELLACRIEAKAQRPSIEALFHAHLLTLPDVKFVGHTHPISVNQILCSPRAREFATRRIFPDEIVCCGGASVFVPYADPGLKLAQAIRAATSRFMADLGIPPRVILLENHGMIALGSSPEAVQAATFMAAKAAEIFIGAAALDGPQFLSDNDIDRIANRMDEHQRRRALNL